MFVLQFVFDKINVCPFRVMTCQEKQVKTSLAFPLTSKKDDGVMGSHGLIHEVLNYQETNKLMQLSNFKHI